MNRGRHKKSNQHLVIRILGKTTANRMIECQKEQGNIPNLDVFLNNPSADKCTRGFCWAITKEGHGYWHDILMDTFAKHPLYKKYKNDRS